ncbi:InlB B-repeat-containing protein [Candidatus Saccharibacteria bacterium]|nr:InlB B-repeat-containing protein [Candidatus Saccharibacteria bacterium]
MRFKQLFEPDHWLNNYYRNLRVSALLLFLSIISFVFVPYLISDANAETATLDLDWTKVVLELDTGSESGNVMFNGGNAITPDEAGKVATVAKTLTVNTTGKHFSVYLSMDSSVGTNQKLCFDFDPSVVEKSSCAHTGIGISPVAEADGAPAQFTGNNWGYALNDGETGFSSAGTYSNNSLSGDLITSTTTNAADLALYNAKWAAVPVFGSEDKIWYGDTNNQNGFGTTTVDGETLTGDSNNTKTVVYGVQVNNALVAGTYGSKILYTAVASASDLNTPSTNVMSSVSLGGPTDVTTLYMDIDAEGAQIRPSQISISLIKHSDSKLADANDDGEFSSTEFETAKTSAVASCPVVSGSLSSGNGSLQIQCVLPELGLSEGMDYDYIVEIPITGGLTRKYISYNTDGSDVGVTRYVGLQTKDANDNYYISTMQGISAGICSMTNTWGTGTGTDARIYNRTGTGQALANTAEASNALGLGTFALEDIRDNKEYLVRRLADGNCWMVQNLALELGDFAGKNDTNGGLTPANTDLTSATAKTRGYWDPSASVMALSGSTLTEKLQSRLGTDQTCTEQFQTKGNYGSGCYWGSKLSDDGNFTLLAEVTNNANAEMPRSYSNGSDWIENDTTYRDSGTPAEASQYIGNYYNWYAATAESGKYSQDSVNAKTENDSICPAGWQLPTDGNLNTDKSWAKLLKNTTNGYGLFTTDGAQSSTTNPYESATEPSLRMHQAPLSIIFSGYYYWVDGATSSRGSRGGYWPSTPYNVTYARSLYFSSVDVAPQNNRDKPHGFTVRCVARDTEAMTVEEEETATTCGAGKICYDGNGGTGTMNNQTANANASVMLTAPTYTKLGYAFVGWNTQENGFGTTYQANETITTPSTLSTAGLQLYAKWLPSAGEMQNWSGCSTLGEHQTVALTDNRDGKAYAVRKLKDGNCWMVNNLNLELANFAGTNNLTSDNTDLSTSRTDLTDLGNGVKAWDPSASTIAKYQSGETFSDFTLRVLGQSQPAQFQSADQTNYWWGSKKSDDGNYTDLDEVINNANAEMPRSYTYGTDGYYNWYAATAESGTYAQASASDKTYDDSICPKGWQLPTDGNLNTDKSWSKLLKNTTTGYGLFTTDGDVDSSVTLKMHQAPLSISFSGNYLWTNGHRNDRNSISFYWYSTPISSVDARGLRFDSTYVNTRRNYNKPGGFPVRCVNRD